MEQNTTLNVWNEITISQSGVGITLYSESQEGGAIVEDETWYTFDELQESTGDIVSLNLSEETVDNLASRQSGPSRQSGSFEEGDIVIDDNAPVWSDNDSVEITEIGETPAHAHKIDRVNTVADVNPQYPADDRVIFGKYVKSTGRVYAFPESRLREK